MTSGGESAYGGWNNGLIATSYVALTDIDEPVGKQVLIALQRSRIAAYLAVVGAPGAERLRLFVAAAERADARTIVATLLHGDGGRPDGERPGDDQRDPAGQDDTLAGIDTDAAFNALIADWHVDTHTAIREAERDLTREDEDWRMRLARPSAADEPWLDDDHFVPPTPPPIPRPTGPIVLGLTLVLLSVLLLAFGGFLGLAFEVRMFLAVCGILSATGVFVTRLRARRDEDDDGAIL